MKNNNLKVLSAWILGMAGIFLLSPVITQAQSYTTWYNKAQERIDTLRKGNFAVQIIDKNGQPYSGPVSVRMTKHEFPFGIAFDFYEGAASMGSSYSTTAAIQCKADQEIYKTERYGDYLAYAIPAESGKNYKITLKFAEIYFGTGNSRLFNVSIEGQSFLNNYDVFAEAGGKNIAKDTSILITPADKFINIELIASRDNASIKGIVLDEAGGGANVVRINCGGPALTTLDGNQYVSEEGYFDPDVTTVASDEQWMKAAMYKYFNYGVSGNSFKWSGIQPQHTAPSYTNFDNAVNWTRKVGWELRAHTLLWGGNDYTDDHAMPRWVKDLPTPEAITDTCKMRVIREMTRYKGIIKEYDVMNEPLHARFLEDSLVGDSINWNCFKWARSADPDAKLFINDYNVEFNWGDAGKYRDLILKIKDKGAPVTGVGMQAHFWDCCRPNIDELVKNVNIVAEAGLPIKFTEYDYGGNLSQKEQAADFIKVLTIAFSHPSIVGMISWGLSDKGAWRENTGFFDANHKPKLAADTLLYYTKTKWATNFDTVMTNGAALSFNAYYGNYNIEVDFNDTVKVFTIPCLKENADSVFTLYEADAILNGPKLLKAELNGDDTVKLVFDKPLNSNSLRKGDFKFFSNYKIGIKNIQVASDDPKALILLLSKAVTKGDYISVSYFPGYLLASDSSKAAAFGPEAISNPAPVFITPYISNSSIQVFPNPAYNNINIVYQQAPYHVTIFNSLGVQVYSKNSETNSITIDVNHFNRGIYLIKCSDANNKVNVQKIILK
jgi:GH35 family endo-1,4-beta-xylanase